MSSSPVAEIAAECIRVRGARVHNLQNIDVDIPRGKLVVITGVSGSGKSSLAFDTLFSEGQRRYLETLSARTRAYLDQMQRPDVDEIEGLPPVLSIEQRVSAVHPRSTLATTTGIHDFLRLLYARAGTAHCPNCGRELSQQSTQAIVDGILALEAGRKAMILAPLLRGKKGMHREVFEKICREGFVRARVDGVIVDASSPPELKKSKAHDIDVIVDRIVVKEGLRARLFESVELALRHGSGACIVSHEEGAAWRDRLFSSRFACPDCKLSFPEIEPRTFSFNSPYGACPTCQGLGVASQEGCPDCQGARLTPIGRAVTFAGIPIHALLALTVTDAEQTINHWFGTIQGQSLPPFARGGRGGRADETLASEQRATTPAVPTEGEGQGGGRIQETCSPPTPTLPLKGGGRKAAQKQSDAINPQSPVDATPPAPPCEGGETRNDKSEIPNPKSQIAFDAAPLAGPALLVAERILPEIHRRLQYLRQVGLDYLSLDRPTQTLSGGEFQRARIAGCLGAGLIGVCYILDEPTIGLHPRDTRRLLDTLCELRDQGNSLIVVEHDLDVMARADYLIDLGPGAGREGGQVVARGTPVEVMHDETSLTGRFLQSRLATGPKPLPLLARGGRGGRADDTLMLEQRATTPAVPTEGEHGESGPNPFPPFARGGQGGQGQDVQPEDSHGAASKKGTGTEQREPVVESGSLQLGASPHFLVLERAAAHNLKKLSVPFPLGVITCVTGVSGSGKSTLVMETLVPRVRAALAQRQAEEAVIRFTQNADPKPPPLPLGEGRGEGRSPKSTASGDGGASLETNCQRRTSAHERPETHRPHPNPLPEGEGTAGARVVAPTPHSPGLSGIDQIDRLVEIDQSPLGRNARSNPATASGMWDEIRRVFARTRAARVRGFRASRFSFNAAGGRCDECRGLGVRRLAMQFLPDIDVVCPVCRGARFNRQTLQVKFRGKSVADVLDLRIDEAATFFENFAQLAATFRTFIDVGLGYLTLGQSAATLSGGEAQRIKLAAELSRSNGVDRQAAKSKIRYPKSEIAPDGPPLASGTKGKSDEAFEHDRQTTRPPLPPLAKGGRTLAGASPVSQHTLYVLDEPTTGLHPADIARLMDLLERLADAGHTVIVIEHQLDVIARSDWVIDLGPEGGAGGGRLVATGTPGQIARVAESHTGQALRSRGAGF